MGQKIRIGTLGSKLALSKANYLKEVLTGLGHLAELSIVETKGEQTLQDGLLSEIYNIAIHPLKDLPTENKQGLVIAALSKREDPADIIIIHQEASSESEILGLKKNAIIGTQDIRRKSQIAYFRNDLETVQIPTDLTFCLQKLKDRKIEGFITDYASIKGFEIELDKYKTFVFNPIEFIPAPGQGVVAYVCREKDITTRKLLLKFHHQSTASCTNVERKLIQLFNGTDVSTLGAYCKKDDMGNFHAHAVFFKDGLRKTASHSQSTNHELAEELFNKLKNN